MLGKLLVRKFSNKSLEGIIVETEAYYGLEDPASRAYKGKKNYNRLMWEDPGLVFIYNVHQYWMLNIVAHELGEIGAVLIRAVEPINGLDVMLLNRPVDELCELTSGPGKLTVAFGIDKNLNGEDVTNLEGLVFLIDQNIKVEIGSSKRIGVREDLDLDLRFYVKGNEYISL
jgi:DNA-3-methyladenine glycosylase